MYFEKWSEGLQSFQEGRIWWNNYLFDIRVMNLAPAVIDDFHRAIENLAETPTKFWDIIEIFEKVINHSPYSFDLKGSRTPRRCDSYSRILSAKACADFHIDWDRLGYEDDERSAEKVWDKLGKFITTKYYKGILQTRRAFFWCTKTSNIDALRGSFSLFDENTGDPRFASEIRNQLGLQSIGENVQLLQIIISEDKLRGKVIRAPTVWDAGLPGIPFTPSDDLDGFGWTLNLATCDRGLEEVVVEALAFGRNYPPILRIGIVSDSPPRIDLSELEGKSKARLPR